MFQQIGLKVLIWAACKFLDLCLHDERCPDGVCEDAISELKAIERKLDAPNVGTAVSSPFDFIKCVDLPRLVSWFKEGIAILNDARMCVDDDNNDITLGAAPDPGQG